MTMKVRLKVNPRAQQVLQAIEPQLKKRNLKTMAKKDAVGDQIALLQIPKEIGREQATAAEDITKNTTATGQKTWYFESKHDKSQTAMGSRNGETWWKV